MEYISETVARELEQYDLDLLGIQQTRWDNSSIESADDHIVFYENECPPHIV